MFALTAIDRGLGDIALRFLEQFTNLDLGLCHVLNDEVDVRLVNDSPRHIWRRLKVDESHFRVLSARRGQRCFRVISLLSPRLSGCATILGIPTADYSRDNCWNNKNRK